MENKWWTWNGRQLAPFFTIVRRLSMWPFLVLARIFLCIVVAIGWGGAEANKAWQKTR